MKKLVYFYFVFLCLFFPLTVTANTTTLHIAHTNDLHAHLAPFDANGQECQEITQPTCLGGYARIKTLISNLRKQHSNLIFLDAGDRFSGTPFYALRKSQDIARLTESLKYDAMTLGNHDLDDGLEELSRFSKVVSAPIIAANVSFPPSSPLSQRITSSQIITRNGKKIGIIGILTPETKIECTGAKNVIFKDITNTLKKHVSDFSKQGIDIIIVLSHIGLDADKELAKQIPNIDIIVGGHSHSFLSNDSSDENRDGPYPIVIESENKDKTLIVTAGMGGRVVGLLHAVFDSWGHIIEFSGNPIKITNDISMDPNMKKEIDAVSAQLEKILNTPVIISKIPVSLTPDKGFCGLSCHIAEVLTTALLKSGKKNNVDVALLNAGGIRAGFPIGQISYRHIIQVYPFNSAVILVEMTGAELKEYIAHGIKKYTPNTRTNALIHPAGLTYTFNSKTKQITEILIQGKPLSLHKKYRVLLPAFLADGGDGFPVQEEQQVFSYDMRNTLIDSLKTIKFISPLEARIKTIDL